MSRGNSMNVKEDSKETDVSTIKENNTSTT